MKETLDNSMAVHSVTLKIEVFPEVGEKNSEEEWKGPLLFPNPHICPVESE